jgi:hypothetical protein
LSAVASETGGGDSDASRITDTWDAHTKGAKGSGAGGSTWAWLALAFDVGAFSKIVSRPARYPPIRRAAMTAIFKRMRPARALAGNCSIGFLRADGISVEGAGGKLERRLERDPPVPSAAIGLRTFPDRMFSASLISPSLNIKADSRMFH